LMRFGKCEPEPGPLRAFYGRREVGASEKVVSRAGAAARRAADLAHLASMGPRSFEREIRAPGAAYEGHRHRCNRSPERQRQGHFIICLEESAGKKSQEAASGRVQSAAGIVSAWVRAGRPAPRAAFIPARVRPIIRPRSNSASAAKI
jgi:hypothetical protein